MNLLEWIDNTKYEFMFISSSGVCRNDTKLFRLQKLYSHKEDIPLVIDDVFNPEVFLWKQAHRRIIP